jgi:hypothetical protein
MKPFERSAEATEELAAFTKKVWDALVPRTGECTSVQGELVRATERLFAEAFNEGMGNYYDGVESSADLARSYYGAMVIFVLDTLVASRGRALDDDDVEYFANVRSRLDADWLARRRIAALETCEGESDVEMTAAEKAEYDELAASPDVVPWQEVLTRAERCVANYCLKNPDLVDRDGKAVVEGGVRSITHIFEPPPAAPPCPKCNGKGWLPPSSPSDFPAMCSCKKPAA